MNRRQSLGVLGVGLSAKLSGDRQAGAARIDSLAVRIVPTANRPKAGRVIQLHQPTSHFYVVATNVSDVAIRLWSERCSWGYSNLSFRVVDEAGQTVEVKKRPRGWDGNFPDWDVIPPGGHHVREVTFDPKTWDGPALPEASRHRGVRMSAVYEILPDEATQEHGVWTGRASSPEESYALWR